MRALEPSAPRLDAPVAQAQAGALPAVVERYLRLAGAERAPIRSVRLRHGGSLRPSTDGKWLPIEGTELFVAEPPGFVWWGRARVMPGLWIDARDKLVDGKGNMLVMAASTVVLANAEGRELDQGAALRMLGEMVFLPTSLRDARYVSWEPIDTSKARATLSLRGVEVAAIFEFGADGMPARVTANRYRDVDGQGVMTPWLGVMSDYRDVGGVRVPFLLEATWELESGPFTYARFLVEDVVFDAEAKAPNSVDAPAQARAHAMP